MAACSFSTRKVSGSPDLLWSSFETGFWALPVEMIPARRSAATSEFGVSLGMVDHKTQGVRRKSEEIGHPDKNGKRMHWRRICVLRLVKDYHESIPEAA
jgi:hypothetical protein